MAKRPPAANTAFGPMAIVACEQQLAPARRLIEDPLAVRLLPFGQRLFVHACRWRPVSKFLLAATEKKAPGIWGGILCRKRYIDDKVAEALDSGVKTVVILGAGLDTRAYRLIAPRSVRAYEVDLPVNVDYKRARLHALYGRIPEHVTLVPIDFETQSLPETLATHGLRIEDRAMFIWEGVTQYLTEAGVRSVLSFLSMARTGSRLVLTYVRQDFMTGKNLYGGEGLYRDFVLRNKVWHFGMTDDGIGALMAEYGWKEQEQVGTELTQRYLQPLGRDLTVSALERLSYAVKVPGRDDAS